MKIFVKVKPRAREIAVEKTDASHFKVSVKEPPVDGKANDGTIRALADYFNLPASQVQLVSGHSSRQKVFEIG